MQCAYIKEYSFFFIILSTSIMMDCRNLGFIIAFSTFLFGCVQFDQILKNRRLTDVVVPQCVDKYVENSSDIESLKSYFFDGTLT